jgi:hypothetical protein
MSISVEEGPVSIYKSEIEILNPKLEILNSKQTQMSKTQNSKPHNLLSFRFCVCLGFRV